MKRILVLGALLLAFGLTAVVPGFEASAVNVAGDACDSVDSAVCDSADESVGGIFQTIINTMLFIVGALSVIMLIYGGIRYTASAGNQDAVKSAKNTIMYAIIGLIVSMLAFPIVNWVISLL